MYKVAEEHLSGLFSSRKSTGQNTHQQVSFDSSTVENNAFLNKGH